MKGEWFVCALMLFADWTKPSKANTILKLEKSSSNGEWDAIMDAILLSSSLTTFSLSNFQRTREIKKAWFSIILPFVQKKNRAQKKLIVEFPFEVQLLSVNSRFVCFDSVNSWPHIFEIINNGYYSRSILFLSLFLAIYFLSDKWMLLCSQKRLFVAQTYGHLCKYGIKSSKIERNICAYIILARIAKSI